MKFSFKFIIWLTILVLFIGGCPRRPDRTPIEKKGRLCGVSKGSFQNNWWQYYERGLSFAECGFYKEAELDFIEALKRRDKDRRRARTYGLHFTDYFVNREYGIILFHQGRLHESMKHLKISLSSVKSSKAEFYLDQARISLIEKYQLDHAPPEIKISLPKEVLTNEKYVEIYGIAKDDQFVRYITINGKNVRVDMSNKIIPFRMMVPVFSGTNIIPVIAKDLSGKTSEMNVIIKSDRIGPIVIIEDPYKFISNNTYRINFYAFDDSGLKEVMINGKKTIYEDLQYIRIQREIILLRGKKCINIEVKDSAGNITSVKKNLTKQYNFSNLIAQNNENSSRIMSDFSSQLVSNDNKNPQITLHRPSKTNKKLTTYFGQVFINGLIQDDNGVKSLFVNGTDILENFYKISDNDQIKIKHLYFAYLHDLHEGENTISINCRDFSGKADQKDFIINWIKPIVFTKEYRLNVVIKKDHLIRDKNVGMLDSFIAKLTHALDKRFSVIKLALLSKNQKDSKKLDVDYEIFCRFIEIPSQNKKEIIVELVDTETKKIFITVDAFYPTLESNEDLKILAGGISIKLSDEMPLVKGNILEVYENQKITVDICQKEKIKPGMKLIVYELDKIGYLMPKEMIIGQAKITEVGTSTSSADLYRDKIFEEIKPKQLVITR